MAPQTLGRHLRKHTYLRWGILSLALYFQAYLDAFRPFKV